MNNIQFIVLIFSCSLIFSCKKDKEVVVQDTTGSTANMDSVKVSDSTLQREEIFQTFAKPPEVQNCSCLFAKSKEDFYTGNYIYVDDYGNTAFVKIDDKLIKIPMEEGDFDPSDISKTIDGKDFSVTIKGNKLKQIGEKTTFAGELILEKKDGTKSSTQIFGQYGC